MKWYIGTLILVLTAFGIYQNKISSPNQEILVQFGADEVTVEQTQTAIASIKEQLQSFGVEVIQVNQSESGKLKIAYYSSVDVESIKKMLSEDTHLMFDYSEVGRHKDEFPSDKKSKSLNFDIYELHQSTDGSQGAAGKSVVIVKQDYDRFFNPNLFVPCPLIDDNKSNQFVREAYKVNRTIAIAIDTISRNIPEVRAGPDSLWNV
ncbi:MAG: hypothetical protein ACSHXF_15375 [Aquaticitalea sp.]